MKKRSINPNFLRILVMVGPSALWLVLFLAVPLVYVVVMSFCTRGLYGGIQYQLSFASYKSIFSTLYLKVTWKSLLMAFETCVICLLIAYPFSWFLSRVPKSMDLEFIFKICHSAKAAD